MVHIVVEQKPAQHCKVIILQLKIKNAEVWNMALECVTTCDSRSSEDLLKFWESHSLKKNHLTEQWHLQNEPAVPDQTLSFRKESQTGYSSLKLLI